MRIQWKTKRAVAGFCEQILGDTGGTGFHC